MARIGGPCKHMARMRARRRPFTAPRAGTAKRQEALERLAAAGVAQHVRVDLSDPVRCCPLLFGSWDFVSANDLVGQSGRHPIPRHPAARITRAYKLRQQPAETPGACIARGSFS